MGGGEEWGNRWMLASSGPWRLGVAVALQSRSPQTAAELDKILFYSVVLYPDLSGAMRTLRTLRLTGSTTHDQRRNKEEGEGLIQGC